MTKKNASKVLGGKFNDFVGSITDETIKKAVRHNTIITGGAVANLLSEIDVNDYDIYFRDKATCELVARYYVKMFNDVRPEGKIKPWIEVSDDRIKINLCKQGVIIEEGVVVKEGGKIKYGIVSENHKSGDVTPAIENNPDSEEMIDSEVTSEVDRDMIEAEGRDGTASVEEVKPKYRPIYITDNAITLSGKVQLITRFYGEPEEIHKNFDYQHCCGYWTSWEGKVLADADTLECLLNKELRYRGSLYPVSSIIRMRKFIKRGWKINAGNMLKPIFQVSLLDLTDLKVLEEQLIGVDSAYFKSIIDYCRQKQKKDVGWTLNYEYLSEILDRIF